MNWLRKMMIGRYGIDQLSTALIILSLALSIFSRFKNHQIITILYIGMAVYAYYRVLSKNTSKRFQENQKFLKYWNPIKAKFTSIGRQIKGLKNYKYFKCTNCKQKIRVPRGKGKIKVRCPKCKTEMIKKT